MCKSLNQICSEQINFDLSLCKISNAFVFNAANLNLESKSFATNLANTDVYTNVFKSIDSAYIKLLSIKASLKPFSLVLVAICVKDKEFQQISREYVSTLYKLGWRDPVYNLMHKPIENTYSGIIFFHALV